jgi:hypothetical protein
VNPLCGDFIFRENRFDRTLRHAGVAVNARLGIYHQHIVIEMERLNRTRDSAIGVTAIDARFSYDVCHFSSASFEQWQRMYSATSARTKNKATHYTTYIKREWRRF